MEERISGLAKSQETTETPIARKSCSREKSKHCEISKDSQEPTVAVPQTVVQTGDGASYSAAVMFKPSATPTRAKKQRNESELGVTPLIRKFILPTPLWVTVGTAQSRVTSTITRPVSSIPTSQAWETGAGNLQEIRSDIQTMNKLLQCDFNQNILTHMDQFGNLVLVQGVAEQTLVRPPVQVEQTQVVERQSEANSMSQSLGALTANPFIQQLVEERVAVLESRIKSEVQQGNHLRKKSGRYNIADTPHCAHLRLPNESYLTGTQHKCTAYDDLTLGQFVAVLSQTCWTLNILTPLTTCSKN